MGSRTIIKYTALAFAAMKIARLMWQKVKEAKSADSAGGSDITLEEWIDLGNSVAEEFMKALPDVEAYVIMIPKDMGWE